MIMHRDGTSGEPSTQFVAAVSTVLIAAQEEVEAGKSDSGARARTFYQTI